MRNSHNRRIRWTRYRVASDVRPAWRLRLMHCIIHKRVLGVHMRTGNRAFTLMIGRCGGPK